MKTTNKGMVEIYEKTGLFSSKSHWESCEILAKTNREIGGISGGGWIMRTYYLIRLENGLIVEKNALYIHELT